MTSVMKFLVLSFSKRKPEFIKTQTLTASSDCRASPAGAAAASPPHSCKRQSLERRFAPRAAAVNKSPGQRLLAVKLPTVTLDPPLSLRHHQLKMGGMSQAARGDRELWIQGGLSANKKRKSCITT